jgi:hypothetical protein
MVQHEPMEPQPLAWGPWRHGSYWTASPNAPSHEKPHEPEPKHELDLHDGLNRSSLHDHYRPSDFGSPGAFKSTMASEAMDYSPHSLHYPATSPIALQTTGGPTPPSTFLAAGQLAQGSGVNSFTGATDPSAPTGPGASLTGAGVNAGDGEEKKPKKRKLSHPTNRRQSRDSGDGDDEDRKDSNPDGSSPQPQRKQRACDQCKQQKVRI